MELSRVMGKGSANSVAKSKCYTTKPVRHRYITQWKQSGLTQAAFCKQSKLHPKSLSRWIKEFESVEPAFTEVSDMVETATAQLSIDHLELRLSNGASIHFRGVLQGSWISMMLQEVCLYKLS